MELNDGELKRFGEVWLSAIASSCYCYALNKQGGIPKGFVRFLLILPIIYLFTILPFYLTSYHLGGITCFFLTWLANFKLLLFSFGQGPLTTSIRPNTPLSLIQFVCICLLPIKVKQNQEKSVDVDPVDHHQIQKRDLKVDPVKTGQYGEDPRSSQGYQSSCSQSAIFAIKMVVLATIIKLYEQASEFPTGVVLIMYCCHVYLGTETALAGAGALAQATLGVEIDPQFNNPYLSTSLQDFWGRRWNLMVPDILRSTVYNPVRQFCTPLIGKEWAMASGTISAFTVSGLMHEWIYYYAIRVSPTWEVTLFFVLHGLCTAIEVKIKKSVRWRLHPVISIPLTVGFVAITGVWLFFPQLVRNQVFPKVIKEYSVVINLFRNLDT